MGSLGSRPSVPAPQSQVVFVPSTSSTATTNTSTSSDVGQADSAADQKSAEQRGSEARSQSLLNRERGRFGTVTTSFRGLLGLNNNRPQKTLLGE